MTVDSQLELSDEVADSIARCAAALNDLSRLKHELHGLRLLSDPHAQFATALFDLERARRADPEAREHLPELAEQLLVFWQAGIGLSLARSHPVLEDLWETAAALLASFESKRFAEALTVCWSVRFNPRQLAVAIEALRPSGNRRVEFAKCLYHLELVRQFVESSRLEFAKRAGLLSDAYRSQEVADVLVGDDPGLRILWDEVLPYLDEFFEMLEQDARRGRISENTPLAGLDWSGPAEAGVGVLEPVEMVDEDDVVTLRQAVPPQAPPPPVDLTPPGSWFPPGVPPPPPRPSVPQPQPAASVTDFEVIEDVEDVEEAPPSRPVFNLDVPLEEADPDALSMAFWQHTIKELSLLPDPRTPRLARRLLNADGRAERQGLTTYLEGLEGWGQLDDARAFSALIRLMLAAQLKEKSLFGQANTRRAQAFLEAFRLLGSTPNAAGHGAVWFVMDGPETLASLHRGLEVLMRFLAFCAREQKDPLDAAAQEAFVTQVNP